MFNQTVKDSIKAILYLLILTLVNLYLPFLSVIVIILWPIPVAVITTKYNFNATAGVIGASALINGIFFGPVMGLLALVGYGLIGFVVGLLFKKEIEPLRALIITVVTVAFSNIILLLISRYMLGINFQNIINEITKMVNQTTGMGDMEDLVINQIQLLQRIFPALTSISAIIMGSLNYYLTNWYINKTGFSISSYKKIKNWFLPRWPIALGIVISLILKRNIIFVNLNIVLLFLVLIQGYAVCLYFIDNKTNRSIVKVIFTIVVLFIPILPPIIILLGLIDFWFDFRKIKFTKIEDE